VKYQQGVSRRAINIERMKKNNKEKKLTISEAMILEIPSGYPSKEPTDKVV
jgi:hypothetical protein